MPKKHKPLLQFNAAYYKYPTSVSRGYWGKYLVKDELSNIDHERRKQWLVAIAERSSSQFHKVVTQNFADSSDKELLASILKMHGIFAERFFHRSIRERIVKRFAEANINLREFQSLLTEVWGHKVDIHHQSDAIYHTTDHIFEQTFFQIIKYAQVHRLLNVWFKEFKTPHTCVLCNNRFRVIDLPDWIYFGSNGFQYCCFQCQILETPRKNELNRLLPTFVEACGFIPNSDANPINYSFTSRLKSDQWTKVILACAKMGGIEHVKKKFGSWFKALAETGALPDGVLATARGIRCLAQDGHTCHSLDEQRIDNWLTANGLDHEREPYYPTHPSLNPKGRRRADWKVGETFIEYFGLIGDPNYEKKMDEKIMLALFSGTDLVAIYPADIENLDQKLVAARQR